jgi:membrane protein YdbS with pleckstrin-like domain
MYSLFKKTALRLMKAPTEPPEPPAGSHGSVQIYRAAPAYLSYALLRFWILAGLSCLLPPFLILLGLGKGEPAPLVIGILLIPVVIVFLFCFYFAVRIDYDMRYYIVTDRSLRVREGAFIVKEMTITYANVQNMRVVQGPILQLFKIWNLKVDTAGGGSGEKGHGGGSSHEVQMAGIENAHEVRDLILGHLRRRGMSAGLGDLDDHDDDSARPTLATPALRDALRELRGATASLRAAAEG